MARQLPPTEPTSLDEARRERKIVQRRRDAEPPTGDSAPAEAYVPAADVVRLLNRIGECVRALPSFGRTRTQTAAVLAKRTLSAISTCSPGALPDDDDLRPVLARVGAARSALRDTTLTGAQQIAAVRWLGQLADTDDPAWADTVDEYGPPAHTYVIRDGEVVRELDGTQRDEVVFESCDERIHDLALLGAVIAAEIDRLQQRRQRRYA